MRRRVCGFSDRRKSGGEAGTVSRDAGDAAMTANAPGSRWARFRLVVRVVELRLRFVAVLAATGLTFAYWDTIANRYEKWMRPSTRAEVAPSGAEFFCPMHPNVVRDEP